MKRIAPHSDDTSDPSHVVRWIAALICLLSVIVVTKYYAGLFGFWPAVITDSKLAQVDVDMKSFRNALDAYRVNAKRYPTNEQGLSSLVEKPTSGPKPVRWVQTMISTCPDPWGNPYRYRFPGSKNPEVPEICSDGPDGKEGTGDDLSSEE